MPEQVALWAMSADAQVIAAMTWAQQKFTPSKWHRCKCGKWCNGKRYYKRQSNYSKPGKAVSKVAT